MRAAGVNTNAINVADDTPTLDFSPSADGEASDRQNTSAAHVASNRERFKPTLLDCWNATNYIGAKASRPLSVREPQRKALAGFS